VKIAVAVPGVKGLHGYRDQEFALSPVANAFASRRVADAFTLMQRVRNVVRERGFFKNPKAIRLGKPGSQHK
jgi:hypothetical protein